MTARPCLTCGDLIPSGSYCDDCRPHHHGTPNTEHPAYQNKTRWRNLSKRMRRLSPHCQDCGASQDLTVDHLIPVRDRPDLTYAIENLAVRCRSCNSKRGTKITDAEIAEIEQRVTEGKKRRARRLRQANAARPLAAHPAPTSNATPRVGTPRKIHRRANNPVVSP